MVQTDTEQVSARTEAAAASAAAHAQLTQQFLPKTQLTRITISDSKS